jgi:SAM-dependent methyltransferase
MIPEPQLSARRGLANRIRHALGLRQSFRISGVRYRECSSGSLRHSLSRKGPGFKEFDAVFPDGSSMRIRCTPQRLYADLTRSPVLDLYKAPVSHVRPGMRVLIPQGGTGFAGAWAGSLVAPSGAVVSLETDAESIEYAQRRYALPNVSFEQGGVEALAGETDGAFDGVIAVETLAPIDEERRYLAELWRLTRPGGWLMYAAPGSPGQASSRTLAGVTGERDVETVLLEAPSEWAAVLTRKPAESRNGGAGPGDIPSRP